MGKKRVQERAKSEYKDVSGWELSDSFWGRIEPLLPKAKSRYRGRGKQRKHIGGRPAADRRKVMTGILYALRTSCQWNAMPKEYGSGKTVHRYFQNWGRRGVFKRMWQAGLMEYEEVKGIEWKWQALDGAISKAPLGGEKTGKNPTDRGKSGGKRSLQVDSRGLPLAVVIAGANVPDSKLLEATLDACPIERPNPQADGQPQNLCLDKGYSDEPSAQAVLQRGYTLHVPDKVNAKKNVSVRGAAANPDVGS